MLSNLLQRENMSNNCQNIVLRTFGTRAETHKQPENIMRPAVLCGQRYKNTTFLQILTSVSTVHQKTRDEQFYPKSTSHKPTSDRPYSFKTFILSSKFTYNRWLQKAMQLQISESEHKIRNSHNNNNSPANHICTNHSHTCRHRQAPVSSWNTVSMYNMECCIPRKQIIFTTQARISSSTIVTVSRDSHQNWNVNGTNHSYAAQNISSYSFVLCCFSSELQFLNYPKKFTV